ncbi:MAG: ABC transporter ATP-binding protein [Chitinophagaceae bacterium]|nr:ABC transporter ATP-binding protein [Chitinophagaceae bacterium]
MSSPSKKSFSFSLLKRVFAYAHPYKKTFYLVLVLSIVLSAIAPLRPYLIQQSVDVYIKNQWLQGLIMITALQLALLIAETLLRFLFSFRINWMGQNVVNDLRQEVFRKILFQDISFYDKTAVGTLTTRSINDMESVNDVFSEGIIAIISDVLTIIAVIVAMLATDWVLTLICLTTLPALILATYWFKNSVNKSFQRVRTAVAALNAFAQEHISGMSIVQAFAAEEREGKKFDEINTEHRNAHIKSIFAYSVFFPIVEIILAVSMGLLVWWGAKRMINYDVTPGVIIAFVMYLNLLFRPLRMMADKFNVLQMGMIAAERIFTVLDSKESIKNEGVALANNLKGDIHFQEVHFAYKPDVPVLRGVTFDIPAGQTMALVGHTGAGKTSIISILNRLYEIQSGNILIDGMPIKEYDIYSLRQHIGIVLQDVFLFSGTVYDNITLRNPDITLAQVQEACTILGIHDFIMRVPGNYYFDVMERGNTLSQGQRQLISFARALLYNPTILILDEATSSIDSESELLVQKAIDTLIKGRTSIVIAHRLSTIRKANQILVLDKGQIIERGTHTELLNLEGAYQKLYTAVEKQKTEV